ncbi:enzymatic polyprotein endonuclease reverse [Lasius niger]|uniref:RNA-directed DNA polymerase n=1 Tax=Lasius niger TaxID=67767 RepID=A0A0J7NA83_LASNI|nr:enzymatic polyprotein endonuclease reverse [Lasius niger]
MMIAISNYPDPAARAGLKVFATNKLIDHFLGGLPRQTVYYDEKIEIQGITEEKQQTLGTVYLHSSTGVHIFHVVSSKFPLKEQGIIEYSNPTTLPGRSICPILIQTNQQNIDNALVNHQEIHRGVFLIDSIVKVNQGKAYTYVTNTNEEELYLEIPVINVEPVEITTSPRDSFTYQINSVISNNLTQRLKLLKENLQLNHLNEEEKQSILPVIEDYNDIFHLPGDKLKGTNRISHSIITTDNVPVCVKQYRYPPIHKDEIKNQVDKLLEQDIIKSSISPYNSPLWVVPKKPDADGNKRWRLVIDFRKLNEKTIGDAYPLPNISDILDQLGKARYFSCFDLASGFHQIPMDPQDSLKTAFSTPNGHYEYKKMPFGLKNAPATFQRLMDNVLTGLQGNVCFVYLDDIVIYAQTLEEHKQKLSQIFDRIKEAGLSLQPEKCQFFKRELMYLGHIISDKGVKPNPEKIKAVEQYPIPKNHKQLKQFLGLKECSIQVEMRQQINFEKLKKLLLNEPILQYPDFDKEFLLTTDASDEGIGAILSQGKIGSDLPIAYASRTLNKAERNYDTTEKELLAIVWAVKHFRPYLYDTPITVYLLESLTQEINDPTTKQNILKQLHNSAIGGHKGVTKTLKRIQQYYSWNGMKQDVKNYIKACHDCQKRKLVREKTKAPMLITDTPSEAFEKVAIDIVGPLPETEKGHKYILTTQDQLTKFCTAYPLLDTSSITIADIIVNKYIYTFGSPKELLSDQASNISGELMKEVAKIFKIKQIKTSVYHPQSNGALERSHHVLAEYLKPYINQNQDNWDSFLDAAMFSYNTAYHEGIKISPYELIFGRKPRLPSVFVEPRQGITHKEFLVDLIDKLTYLRKNAKENLFKAKESAKEYYDKRIKPLVLDPGEYVYVLHETVRTGSKKLTDQYDGPFEIIRKLSDVNYEIKRGKRNQVLHVNKLKRAYFPLQGDDVDND